MFTDLVRDAAGWATMTVQGKAQAIDVLIGPNYRAVVVYAPSPRTAPPPDRNWICFEPMAAITNAMNMAHNGLYKELQSIPPGQSWQASFRVRPRGF